MRTLSKMHIDCSALHSLSMLKEKEMCCNVAPSGAEQFCFLLLFRARQYSLVGSVLLHRVHCTGSCARFCAV